MDIIFLFISVIPLLVALYKIEWGIWAFVFIIPGYALRVPFGFYGMELTISMVEIAALLLFPILLTRIKIKNISFDKLLLISITLFVGGLLLSLSQSNDILKSFGVIRGWVVVPIIFAALLYLSKINFSKTLVSAFVFSGIFVALVSPFWEGAFGGGRIEGFYESPNYLAMYLAPLLPLIAWYIHRNWSNSVFRYALLGGMGVVFITVLFSFSRGAWMGLLAGGILATIIFCSSWIRKNWGIVLFGSSLFCASLAVLLLFTNFSGYLLNAFYSRSGIWEAALTMLSHSPLLGVGAGMFQTAFTVQKHFVLHPVPVEVALHPHNIFLATWLYGGVMGLLGFLGILFWTGKNLYIKIKAKGGPGPPFAAFLAVSFVIILVHGLVDTTYWKNDLAFMWWMLVILLLPDLE